MKAAQMDAVGFTARWVAAARARESERPDGLFVDPCAHALAGPEAFLHLERLNALSEPPSAGPRTNLYLPVRTRFFDDYLLYAAKGCSQIVLLAAGMDARAFRLDWPEGTRLFEIDRPPVFAYKESVLDGIRVQARCERNIVATDLACDWKADLIAAGFDPSLRTAWLAEGLFVYLTEDHVHALLRDLAAMSAPTSRLAADIADVSLLGFPPFQPYLAKLVLDGSPWTFGTKEPELLFETAGWRARAMVIGEPGTCFGRWPYPAEARGVPGRPRTYFVTSIRGMNTPAR